MPTKYSNPSDRDVEDKLIEVARSLLGTEVNTVRFANSGRNGRVFKVVSNYNAFAMKFYPPLDKDSRDRLETEYRAFSFLHDANLTVTPRALARIDESRVALYEWIDGSIVKDPSDADVDDVITFVRRIKELSDATPQDTIGVATEASLSAQQLIHQIESRLQRLQAVAPGENALAKFLADDVVPAIASQTGMVRRDYTGRSAALSGEIKPSHRILSPSDFGFHNSIRCHNGPLIFVDFEYFGWDDPIRLVSDFVLHPGMKLSDNNRRRFVSASLDIFSTDDGFAHRLDLHYPLVVLRWCMILLNEFLPEKWNARTATDTKFVEAVQLEQLKKAQVMLEHLSESPTKF